MCAFRRCVYLVQSVHKFNFAGFRHCIWFWFENYPSHIVQRGAWVLITVRDLLRVYECRACVCIRRCNGVCVPGWFTKHQHNGCANKYLEQINFHSQFAQFLQIHDGKLFLFNSLVQFFNGISFHGFLHRKFNELSAQGMKFKWITKFCFELVLLISFFFV